MTAETTLALTAVTEPPITASDAARAVSWVRFFTPLISARRAFPPCFLEQGLLHRLRLGGDMHPGDRLGAVGRGAGEAMLGS
ncbi:hypothetical protein GCM10010522_10920 [Kribbella solani]